MVRFIIGVNKLLALGNQDLHSNMVRFIINSQEGVGDMYGKFTFQYG